MKREKKDLIYVNKLKKVNTFPAGYFPREEAYSLIHKNKVAFFFLKKKNKIKVIK